MTSPMGRCLALTIWLVALGLLADAQTSAAGRNSSWFKNEPEVRMARLSALSDADLDRWVAAASKSDPSGTRSLGLVLMRFNPLFDSKNQVVAGGVAKYAARLAQLSKAHIAEWMKITGPGVGFEFAAIGLTAEDGIFPAEKFDANGFQRFLDKYK